MKKSAEEVLHIAVCQAVTLLNVAPEVARSAEGRDARNILRKALSDYADAYMDQPVTESERTAVARKHQKAKRQPEAQPAEDEAVSNPALWRGALLWTLWHHQGGSSAVGQPIRRLLGIGEYDALTDEQIAEAKAFEANHRAAIEQEGKG